MGAAVPPEHPSERTFVAHLLTREIVGQAAVIFGTHAGFFLCRRLPDQERDASGAASYRGALVRARWDAAVES